jgi:hypothetical protein
MVKWWSNAFLGSLVAYSESSILICLHQLHILCMLHQILISAIRFYCISVYAGCKNHQHPFSYISSPNKSFSSRKRILFCSAIKHGKQDIKRHHFYWPFFSSSFHHRFFFLGNIHSFIDAKCLEIHPTHTYTRTHTYIHKQISVCSFILYIQVPTAWIRIPKPPQFQSKVVISVFVIYFLSVIVVAVVAGNPPLVITPILTNTFAHQFYVEFRANISGGSKYFSLFFSQSFCHHKLVSVQVYWWDGPMVRVEWAIIFSTPEYKRFSFLLKDESVKHPPKHTVNGFSLVRSLLCLPLLCCMYFVERKSEKFPLLWDFFLAVWLFIYDNFCCERFFSKEQLRESLFFYAYRESHSRQFSAQL